MHRAAPRTPRTQQRFGSPAGGVGAGPFLRPGPARGRSVPGSRQARPPGEATAVPNTWWSSSTGTTCHRDMTFHGLRLMTSCPGTPFRGGWVGAPGDRGGARGRAPPMGPARTSPSFQHSPQNSPAAGATASSVQRFSPCPSGTTQIGRSGPGRGPEGGTEKGTEFEAPGVPRKTWCFPRSPETPGPPTDEISGSFSWRQSPWESPFSWSDCGGRTSGARWRAGAKTWGKARSQDPYVLPRHPLTP